MTISEALKVIAEQDRGSEFCEAVQVLIVAGYFEETS